MSRNTKFMLYGAIVAFVFITMFSGLADITRLVVVVVLCAMALAIERWQ